MARYELITKQKPGGYIVNNGYEPIPADARKMIEAAANRAGMSISEWLNTIILDAAAEEGIKPVRYVFKQSVEKPIPVKAEIASLCSRIDDLATKIETLANSQIDHAPRNKSAPVKIADNEFTIFDRLAGIFHLAKPGERQHRQDQRRVSL